MFKSTNGGTTWAAANTGWTNQQVRELALHSDGQTLFAGTAANSIFKSTNGALSSESRLLNLALTTDSAPALLSPSFNSEMLNYTANVQGPSLVLTPTAWIGDASMTINGVSAPLDSDYFVALNPGTNMVSISLTSGDQQSTRTYTIEVYREPIAPGVPTSASASPGDGKALVHWLPPVDVGSGISQYTVTAFLNGLPAGQGCTLTPPAATHCEVMGLTNGQTYTFSVVAESAGAESPPSEPTNPVTPLVNPKAFSAPSPDGSGLVTVTVSGGAHTCTIERMQLLSSDKAQAPDNLDFPHGVLDFVLGDCDTSAVTLTMSYPKPLPQRVAYWKKMGQTWEEFAGGTAASGTTTAQLVLVDGGEGDADGSVNGRIVDPGGVAVMHEASPNGVSPVPTLGQWALIFLSVTLLAPAWQRLRHRSS